MERYLAALRARRAKVQAEIDSEYARPCPDSAMVSRLKKLKLSLRDAIVRLERAHRADAARHALAAHGKSS